MSGRRVIATRTYLEMRDRAQLTHAPQPDAAWRVTALRMLNDQQQTDTGLVKLYPNILQRGQPLYIQSGFKETAEYIITDINGKLLDRDRFVNSKQIESSQLLPGIYFLKWTCRNNTGVKKFVISH